MNEKLSVADVGSIAGFLSEAGIALAGYEKPRIMPSAGLAEIAATLERFRAPLSAARTRGIFINPWTLAGLKWNEVRTTNALAGLWDAELGGETARSFLAAFLNGSGVDVRGEYSVQTEVNPLGLAEDRLDMVITTEQHLVGIEVKINAGETKVGQLKSYRRALKHAVEGTGREAILVFLAPDGSDDADHNRTWQDVAKAARSILPKRSRDYDHNHWLIAHFADHIRFN